MAGNVVESLAIQIGVETDDLESALQNLAKSANALRPTFEGVAQKVNELTGATGNASKEGGENLNKLTSASNQTGNAFKRAGDSLKKAFDVKTLSVFEGGLKRLAIPLAGIFSVGASFRSFLSEGEALDDFSKRLHVNAQQVDAWSRASRDAGGSAQGLKSALESFMKNTGQGAEAFFSLGKRIQGMSDFSARKTLEALGVSGDAQNVFLKHRENAEAIAKSYEKIATTGKQAETAKRFNLAMRGLSDTFHAFAYDLFMTVTPTLETVLKLLRSGLTFLADHAGIVKVALTALSAYMAGAWIASVLGTVKALGGLSGILKVVIVQMRTFLATLLANPIGLVITALVALVAVLEDVYTFAVGGRSVFGAFLKTLGLAPETIKNIRESFASFFGYVGKVASAFFDAFKAQIQVVISLLNWIFGDGSFKDVGASFVDALEKGLGGVPKALTSFLVEPFNHVISDVKRRIAELKGMAKGFVNTVKGVFGFGDPEEDGDAITNPSHAQSIVAQMATSPNVTNSDNRQTVNVETHITTSADPESVANAVANGVNRGLARNGAILVNANTGVLQKG